MSIVRPVIAVQRAVADPDPVAMTVPDDQPPKRPHEPDPADCCGEGCAHCVFDRYEAALERYEIELAAWHARQHESGARNDDIAG
jgi:hypothetical protein